VRPVTLSIGVVIFSAIVMKACHKKQENGKDL